jgi:hypothetical protein
MEEKDLLQHVIYKLNKYKSRYELCTDLEKKQIYAQKVGFYMKELEQMEGGAIKIDTINNIDKLKEIITELLFILGYLNNNEKYHGIYSGSCDDTRLGFNDEFATNLNPPTCFIDLLNQSKKLTNIQKIKNNISKTMKYIYSFIPFFNIQESSYKKTGVISDHQFYKLIGDLTKKTGVSIFDFSNSLRRIYLN